jgi:hypothetical protein
MPVPVSRVPIQARNRFIASSNLLLFAGRGQRGHSPARSQAFTPGGKQPPRREYCLSSIGGGRRVWWNCETGEEPRQAKVGMKEVQRERQLNCSSDKCQGWGLPGPFALCQRRPGGHRLDWRRPSGAGVVFFWLRYHPTTRQNHAGPRNGQRRKSLLQRNVSGKPPDSYPTNPTDCLHLARCRAARPAARAVPGAPPGPRRVWVPRRASGRGGFPSCPRTLERSGERSLPIATARPAGVKN